MLASPMPRIWWSGMRRICSNMRRQPSGLMAGINPSSTSNKASAIHKASDIQPTPGHFLAAGAAALPPRKVLKKSLLWSSTITSDLLRNVAR